MFDQLIGKTPCPNQEDACFAEDATLANNPDAAAVEPECPEWVEGFKCDTPQFLGKLNWVLRAFTVGLKAIITQLAAIVTRLDALEGIVRLEDVFINGANELVEVYSDNSTQINSLAQFLVDNDTDTNTRYDNPTNTAGPGANQVTITWDIIDVMTNAVVGSDSTIITVGGNVVDTNTFLSSVGGVASGTANFNAARQLPFVRSDSTTWNINAPASTQILATPATVVNVTQARSAGTLLSGTTAFNLNSIATVPAGARAVILRGGVSVDGQQDNGGGNLALFARAWLQVRNINAGFVANPFSLLVSSNVVAYTDTNDRRADDADTNEVIVPLTAGSTTIFYNYGVAFGDTFGTDNGVVRLFVVGYLF